MQRKPKKASKNKIDLFKPINPEDFMEHVKEDDCFGKEWSGEVAECKVCGVEAVCVTICRKGQKKKEAELEKKEGPYLDQMKNLTKKQEAKIELFIKSSEETEPVTTQEMFETFKRMMKTKDDVAVVQAIKRFIKGHDVKTSKGKFYSK